MLIPGLEKVFNFGKLEPSMDKVWIFIATNNHWSLAYLIPSNFRFPVFTCYFWKEVDFRNVLKNGQDWPGKDMEKVWNLLTLCRLLNLHGWQWQNHCTCINGSFYQWCMAHNVPNILAHKRWRKHISHTRFVAYPITQYPHAKLW